MVFTWLHRGINNTPLHPFQHETTQSQYCTIVIRQLAMLLRHSPTYQIPLTENLQRALGLFRSSLEQGLTEKAKEDLHSVLMALWKQRWRPTSDNLLPCPTIRALALFTLKQDGHFLEPINVTGIIAKWDWCLRLA